VRFFKVRKRTKARELTLKFLYQIDITGDNPQSALDDFWQMHNIRKDIREFADTLIRKTLENLKEIDKAITSRAENWQLKRMATVDRNVLRLACCELIFMPDIPAKVSINEAINLAKKYGDFESGKFVNGILDKVKKDITDKIQNQK
jgi:transcription antitermination factor NusB